MKVDVGMVISGIVAIVVGVALIEVGIGIPIILVGIGMVLMAFDFPNPFAGVA